MIASVQNRVVGKFRLMRDFVRLQPHQHILRLQLLVLHRDHANRLTLAVFRPQFFLKQFRIIRNHRIGRIQNPLGRAVILLQFDHLDLRKVALQQFQIVQSRAAPRINRLIIVAHGGEHRARAGQQLDQLILHRIGVLILVHQNIADFRLPALTHLIVAAQQFHRQTNQIVKIHRLIRLYRRVVIHIHTRKLQFALIGRDTQRLLRCDLRIFPQRNRALHGFQQRLIRGCAQLLQN